MFKEIFLFEIRYRLRRPATWAYFGILMIFGLFIAIGGNGPASEKVFVNSPVAIATMLAVLSIFGIMLASAIMGVPVYRDIEHKSDNYYFSYPISEKGYLLGRFFGSLVVLFLISLGFHAGLMIGYAIGPYAGYVEPERFTDFNLWYYIQPTLILYWTNFFFGGCIFFSLVTMTKKVMLAYAGGAILFIIYLITLTLTEDISNKTLVSLLDPFGFGTYLNVIEYWTPEEQNSMVVPFTGLVLWNRIIWMTIGLLALLYTLFRFDFQKFLTRNYTSKKKNDNLDIDNAAVAFTKIPKVSKTFSASLNFKLLFKLAFMEFKNIVRDNFFIAILIAATIFLLYDSYYGSPIDGTPSLPMTYYMLEMKRGNFTVLIFILIVFMTGEVLHRERSVNYDQIFGALPIPNRIVYLFKFLALALISFLLVNIILFSGVVTQTMKGYYNYEFSKYFTDLYLIEFPKYIIFVLLAFFVHSLVTKKFVGHVTAIAIWLLLFGLNAIGDVDNNLYLYSYAPNYILSDMNGFGHFGEPLFWFRTYWLACGGVLLLIGYLFWKRGTDSGSKARWQNAKARLNYTTVSAFVILLLIFIGSGIFINYNTSTLNDYKTDEQNTIASANYEKQLSKYFKVPQPKVVGVKLYADLYPKTRSARMKVEYKVVNKTQREINKLHLNWGDDEALHRKLNTFTIDGVVPKLEKRYDDFSYEIYELPKVLKPNDTVTMVLDVSGAYEGFRNEGSGLMIVYNGSFLNNGFFPSFGYDPQAELTSDQDRKKYNLPIKDYQFPEKDNPDGLKDLLFENDADLITFEGTIGTDGDQTAILPGYLQKKWKSNGRNYFSYKMNDEMILFYNISSGRYDVYREMWTGKSGEKVNLEIYHHPSHTYNLDRFVKSLKKSMDYFSENYGPYQYTQMRILEYPRYANFAQSFANTVPFSESFA